jgi:hypothetical protein
MESVISFSRYFVMNVEFLSKDLNIPIAYKLIPNNTYHIFSGHDAVDELIKFKKVYPKTKYIIYQSENIKSAFFTKQYIELLRLSDVYQYSPMIAEYCLKKWNIPFASYFTFNYLSPSCFSETKDIDILFFGTMTKKRHDILREIQHVFKKHNVVITNDTFCEDLDKLLCRTKVVLNISAYDDNALETHRINQCIRYEGLKIVSNHSCDKLMDQKYKDIIIFTKGRHVGDYLSALSSLFTHDSNSSNKL